MMDFLTVSIETNGMEEYLWGINLKSMQFIYFKIDDKIRKEKFKLGDVLSFEEEYCGRNKHEYAIAGDIKVKERDRESLYNILELKASYPIGLLKQSKQDRVLKIEYVKNVILSDKIYLIVKVYGVNGIYKVLLSDSKWVSYWNNKYFEKDVDGTLNFLNHVRDKYLILDYSDYGLETEIHSCGLVLNYE